MEYHKETENNEFILNQLTWRDLYQESFSGESDMFVYNHIKYVCIYTFTWIYEQVINMERYNR